MEAGDIMHQFYTSLFHQVMLVQLVKTFTNYKERFPDGSWGHHAPVLHIAFPSGNASLQNNK